jgi:tRNA threonylcarbamoyladenosine biosynthesis protein TsaB
VGPGSYTGIRAAISLAQGWQLAREVKVAGLSSANCIAAQAQEDGFTGQAGVVIDAQRKEFYLGLYALDNKGWQEQKPLRLVTHAEVAELEQSGLLLIGPEVTRWFPAGRLVFPRASTLLRLAVEAPNYVPGEKLEPIYLRETTFIKAPPPRAWPD